MAEDRRTLTWLLSSTAKILPPAERQQFREFLNGLDGAEPRRRKVHSWHRKKKPAKTVKPKRPAKARTCNRSVQGEFFD